MSILDKAIVPRDSAVIWVLGNLFYFLGVTEALEKKQDSATSTMLRVAQLSSVVTAGFYIASRVSKNYIWIACPALNAGATCLAARYIYVQDPERNSKTYGNLIFGAFCIALSTASLYLGFAASAIFLRNSDHP